MGNPIAQHVWHFLGKVGHEFALVFESEVIDVVAGSPWTKLLDRSDLVGLVSKAPATGWGGRLALPGGGNGYVPAQESKEAAVAALRAKRAEVLADAEREATDPIYALEKLLKHYDWYSHYSDDHRVWSAGERDSRRLQELLKIVPEDVGKALVEKYHPKG